MKWRCPICKQPTDSEQDQHFPFCSDRCRLTDLGNWASEKYRVSEPALEEQLSGESAPESHEPDESKN